MYKRDEEGKEEDKRDEGDKEEDKKEVGRMKDVSIIEFWKDGDRKIDPNTLTQEESGYIEDTINAILFIFILFLWIIFCPYIVFLFFSFFFFFILYL